MGLIRFILSLLFVISLDSHADTARAVADQIPAIANLFSKKDKGQSTPVMPGAQGIKARDCLRFVIDDPKATTVQIEQDKFTYSSNKELFREIEDPKYYSHSYFQILDVEKVSCMPAGGKMPSGFNASYSRLHEEKGSQSSSGMFETCYLRAVNKRIVACPLKYCLTAYLPILKAKEEMDAATPPIAKANGRWKSDAEISSDAAEVKRLKDAYSNARTRWEHLSAEWQYKQNDEYCGLR